MYEIMLFLCIRMMEMCLDANHLLWREVLKIPQALLLKMLTHGASSTYRSKFLQELWYIDVIRYDITVSIKCK